MKNIIISVSNDLYTDQRVSKMCDSLLAAGYAITLVGRLLPDSKPLLRAYPTKRLQLLFQRGPLFYAELNIRLFFLLLFSKKDILWANDMDTLVANVLVSRLQGKTLVFDSHELFSEIPELVRRPKTRWIWKGLERRLIPLCHHTITVSEGIAQYYEQHYKIKPLVIRNYPQQTTTSVAPIPGVSIDKKVVFYQGALNMGRGLELLITTLPLLPDWICVLAGTGDLDSKLKQMAQEHAPHQVFFLGKISPQTLHSYTPNAQIGVSLEEDLGLNYRYALPNKLFDYVQAEIPVIVSDLPEMSSVVTQYTIGIVLKERTPEALAECIQKCAGTDFKKELANAKNMLTWASQENTLHTLLAQLD